MCPMVRILGNNRILYHLAKLGPAKPDSKVTSYKIVSTSQTFLVSPQMLINTVHITDRARRTHQPAHSTSTWTCQASRTSSNYKHSSWLASNSKTTQTRHIRGLGTTTSILTIGSELVMSDYAATSVRKYSDAYKPTIHLPILSLH